mgnify:CR=1 FL=1
MKKLRILVLCLLALLLIGGYGCGGGGSGDVGSESGTDETTREQTQNEIDETASRIVEKLLATGEDGSPAVFDYAPETETEEESTTDNGEVNFVKYVSSRDLAFNDATSDDRYVKTINLTKDAVYVIKYSHGGRNLNQSALDLIVTMPDKREMRLYFNDSSSEVVSVDEISSPDIDKTGLDPADEAAGLTLEEVLAEEQALEESRSETSTEPLYVKAKLEIIPEENPCIILYTFKAPLTGNYDFAVRESNITSSGDVVPFDIPFEFRVYGSEESYSAADDEEIELTPREILDIQRILIDNATEFNENGLPIAFEADDDNEAIESSKFYASAVNSIMIKDISSILNKGKKPSGMPNPFNVKLDPIINNVPYDEIFTEGAGFYAHSGLHAITGEAINMDDYLFSDNAVKDFNGQTPVTGSKVNMNEDLKVNIIATEEEHDRVMGLDAMSNFALIRNALGYNGTDDRIRLGSNGARVMSVRYDYIEQSPRYLTSDKYKLTDSAMALLKENYNLFQREHGDYFVAGYTWGLCYDAVIEITAIHRKCYHSKVIERTSYGEPRVSEGESDPGKVCDDVAAVLKEIFSRAKTNAMSVRNTGRTSQNDVNRINELITLITTDWGNNWWRHDESFGGVTISVKINKYTGVVPESSLSLRGFVDSLMDFMAKAPSISKSKYEPLYVTLMRYRELEEAKPYIPEILTTITTAHYDRIRDLTTKIYRTRCYYNGIMAIPDDHWLNGASKREEIARQFTNLVEGMERQLNKICSDINNVNNYYNTFDDLYNKYKALAERYAFYRYFVDIQNERQGSGWNEPCGTGGCIGGFKTYDKSSLVQGDFNPDKYYWHHEEPCTSGPGGVRFQKTFSNYERVNYFETGYVNTNYSKAWDNQGGTVGKKSVDWQYKCASSRRLEVNLDVYTVRMPPDKYPFAGLSD